MIHHCSLIKDKYCNTLYFLQNVWWVSPSAPVYNVHVCLNVSVRVCLCDIKLSAHSLWSGCSSCVAKVTSFSAMLVGMWRLRLRPAHKTLHPGTVLLPLQTGKQRPMGKPHRRPVSGASLYCCFFFQSHTCCSSADPRVKTLSSCLCGSLSLWPVSLHLNREKTVILQAGFAHVSRFHISKCYYKQIFFCKASLVLKSCSHHFLRGSNFLSYQTYDSKDCDIVYNICSL